MPVAGRRYWEERFRLTVKGVVAACVAWLVARHLVGHPEPYFAPLAALLGVYPTVARSVTESLAYGAGFVIGALLAIPIGLLIGPNTFGIAAVLLVAMMIAGWRRLGDQSPQVAFTALFTLLFGGHGVAGYVLPRLGDVGIGLVIGLAVNVLIFPPLYLRQAEYAVGELRRALNGAMETLAEYVVAPHEWQTAWEERESWLLSLQKQTRYSVEQAQSSLRANPRAWWWGYPVHWREVPDKWAAPRQLNALDTAMSYTRSIAGTLRLAADTEDDEESPRLDRVFRDDYAALLRELAGLTMHLPEPPDEDLLAEAERRQDDLEGPRRGPGTDVAAGLWDYHKELLRFSRLLLDHARSRRA